MSQTNANSAMTTNNTNKDLSNYQFHLWTSKTAPIKYLTELLKDLLTLLVKVNK